MCHALEMVRLITPKLLSMKNSVHKFWLTLGIVAAASLSACGGGGDGDSTASTTSGTTTETTPPAANTTDAAEKYVGTYLLPCASDDDVRVESSGGEHARSTFLYTFKKTAAGSLNFTEKRTVYADTDSTCSGAVLATHTNNNPSNTFTIEGQVTAPRGGVQVTVDKVTSNLGPLGGGLTSATTTTINGLVYPGSFFTQTHREKSLFYVDGQRVYVTDYDLPYGADGYPTAVSATRYMQKQ